VHQSQLIDTPLLQLVASPPPRLPSAVAARRGEAYRAR
jgi:hypothetical protein